MIEFIVTWTVITQVCGGCPNSSHPMGAYGDGPIVEDAVACCHDETRSQEQSFAQEVNAREFIAKAPPNASGFRLYRKEELRIPIK